MYKYKYKYKYGPTHQEAQEMIQTNYIKVTNKTAGGLILRVKVAYTLNGERQFRQPTGGFGGDETKTIDDLPAGASDVDIEVEVYFTKFFRFCFWENVTLPACFIAKGSLLTPDCIHLVC
jgi:hypothetical protein